MSNIGISYHADVDALPGIDDGVSLSFKRKIPTLTYTDQDGLVHTVSGTQKDGHYNFITHRDLDPYAGLVVSVSIDQATKRAVVTKTQTTQCALHGADDTMSRKPQPATTTTVTRTAYDPIFPRA